MTYPGEQFTIKADGGNNPDTYRDHDGNKDDNGNEVDPNGGPHGGGHDGQGGGVPKDGK